MFLILFNILHYGYIWCSTCIFRHSCQSSTRQRAIVDRVRSDYEKYLHCITAITCYNFQASTDQHRFSTQGQEPFPRSFLAWCVPPPCSLFCFSPCLHLWSTALQELTAPFSLWKVGRPAYSLSNHPKVCRKNF